MNRRQLLAGALAGAALLSSPHLALAGVSPKKRARLLKEQWNAAKAHGKHLLMLVIPDEAGWDRGHRLGIWLNNASDEELAPLAKVEVVCATLGELAEHVPGVEEAQGAWMVLVDVNQDTPTWRSVVVPSVPENIQRKSYEDFTEDFVKAQGHKPDWGEINRAYRRYEERAAQGRLGAELEAFHSSIGRVFASEGLTGETGGKTQALAKEARDNLVKRAPLGAHWASAWGCGTTIEPNPDDDPKTLNRTAYGCGMGHVEKYEARFLHFWAIS